MIFVDPEEGVVAPGIKAVTFTRTRADDGSGGTIYVDPYEEIITDFSSLTSRGNVTNCLMASNPDIYCDSERGSGKRIKTYITGPTPFDMQLRTTPSADYPSVDYLTFGKASNFTGARMTGFSLQLLDSDGVMMDAADPANAVLFNLDADQIGLGSGLPDGLFGSGGNEGTIGFFSSDKAMIDLTESDNELAFGALSNAEYVANFGTAILDDTMVPEGMFWDDNADPDDEGALVAWNNPSAGGWTYGTLEVPADIDARLDELAASLGVVRADLGYVDGGLVPDDIVASMQANGLFEVDAIEDLRNANLNYTITVGNIEAEEYILRFAPTFSPIVTETTSEYQFRTAGHLDAAANVPYFDTGNAAAYQTTIDDILALDAAEQAEALERTGFSFLGAFSGLGMSLGRDQVFAVGLPSVEFGNDGIALSTKGEGKWAIGENLRGFVSAHGSSASFETTANGIGYDVKSSGFNAGLEASISPTASVGVMIGSLDGKADAFAGRGTVDASGWSLAAYGRTTFGEGGTLQAVVGYQDLSFDTARNVFGGGVATGATDGTQKFMALQADYMFNRGALTWGPMASIERYKLSVDGFDETGAGAMNIAVGEQEGWTTVASIGARGEYAIGESGKTRAYGSLALTQSSGDDQLVSSGFVGLPSGGTPVDAIDQNWVDARIGLTSVVSQSAGMKTVVGAEYRGSYGSSYESHGLGLFVKMEF
ncbi:choice-of-anchor F family protein [uncultured Aliiroseovarius sp.]|nr:choice-of-anchor F family protein [uncultured Aliiroseovarius sp.]